MEKKNSILIFVLRSILFIIIVILLCWFSFSSMRIRSRAFNITMDGMVERANYIIRSSEHDDMKAASNLLTYFTADFVENDTQLNSGLYDNYTIRNYDYTLQIHRISGFPWSKKVTATADELVSSISGSPINSQEGIAQKPPQWDEMRYSIVLVKSSENRWLISEINPIDTVERIEFGEK